MECTIGGVVVQASLLGFVQVALSSSSDSLITERRRAGAFGYYYYYPFWLFRLSSRGGAGRE